MSKEKLKKKAAYSMFPLSREPCTEEEGRQHPPRPVPLHGHAGVTFPT